MESALRPDTGLSAVNPSARDGTLSQALAGAHGVVDKAATAADEALSKIKPALDRVAEGAHQAVDKAAGVAVPAAKWLSERSDRLEAARQSLVADSRRYASANPWKMVAVALAAGLLIGRLLR